MGIHGRLNLSRHASGPSSHRRLTVRRTFRFGTADPPSAVSPALAYPHAAHHGHAGPDRRRSYRFRRAPRDGPESGRLRTSSGPRTAGDHFFLQSSRTIAAAARSRPTGPRPVAHHVQAAEQSGTSDTRDWIGG